MPGQSEEFPRPTPQPACLAECFVSETRYLELINSLCTRIEQLAQVPDCIIGVKRSGLFPAVCLSHRLSRPMLVDSETKNFPSGKFVHPVIIDTTCWNGRSLRTIHNRLVKQGVSKIAIAVMIARRDPAPNIPNLICLETSDTIPHFWYEICGREV